MKKINSFDGEFAFLSNFYDSEITDGVRKYPTVEHYFQAMKALDNKKRDAIAHASTPGQAKRLGRKTELRKDWESIKIEVMRNALIKKFAIPELRAKL